MIRQDTVEFWLFIFQNSVTSGIALRREYCLMPSIILDILNVVDTLTYDVMCRGTAAIPDPTSSQIQISSSSQFLFRRIIDRFVFKLCRYDTVETLTVTDPTVAFNQLRNAEIDVAIFIDYEINATTFPSEVNGDDLLFVPFLPLSTQPIFNPQITDDS